MDEQQKTSLLNNLIGTPEVTIKIKNSTILLFFGSLVISMIIIFLAHEAIQK